MQSVSDPNLSQTHISPTRHSHSHTFRSKIVARPKHGRKSSGSGTSSSSSSSSSSSFSSLMSRVNQLHPYDMNYEESSKSNSPYYKGLTDQSLAILDDLASSCPAPHTHTHTPSYPNSNTNTNTNLFSSGHSSPYYKGLTDYSLVIGSWSPVLHNLPVPATAINSLSHESSPYYRGLIDYSLALHAPHTHTHTSNSHSSMLSINIKSGEEIMEATPGQRKELMTKMVHDDVDFVIEEKPMRERVSEESKVGSPLQEIVQKTTMELMTKRVDVDVDVDVDDDVGLVIEEKPLREKESEASKVGIVLEENAEKTISEEMELMNDDGLVIEEKPLSESVSEASKVEMSVLAEKTILEEIWMDVGKEEQLGGDYGLLGGEKEKKLLLSVSEKTVASEEGNVYDYDYIWATKYQPWTLTDFICNRDKALELKELVREGCGCNHFIFEGPPSVGKRSMIRAMLREVFGADTMQVREECKDFNLKGEMVDNLKVRIKKSVHHVEVNLSETKGYEKHVIVELFKETYGKIINNSLPCSPKNCQAIVLYEAEKLSTESLLYIKWLLEKYKGCNKVFFCCSHETKLQLVKPLCTRIQLSPPTSQEILKILEYVGKEEGIKLSRDFVKKIILRSKNNLRQAIRSLEATCRNKDALKDDDLILTGWEDDISNIAKNIIEEQSPRQLYVIRRKLQSFMIHDVSPDFIYKSLVVELTTLVEDSLRSGVAKLDKEYSKVGEIKFETMKQFRHAQNRQGDSDERNELTKKNALSYLKVEEFIAKFMSWYKNLSEKSNKHVQLIAGSLEHR